MTYLKAKNVQIGDVLRAKDGFVFTVERIEEKTDEANLNKYFIFSGTCTNGFMVYYDHKKLR